MDVKTLADKIERRLKRAGVQVSRNDAPTGSVYMFLDKGLAYSIRISDHEDALRWRYRYNMLTCRFLHKRRHNGDMVRFYYSPEDYYNMINAILSVRKSKMMKFGIKEYHAMLAMRKENTRHKETN